MRGLKKSSSPPPARLPPGIDPTKVRLVKDLRHGSPLIGCRFDPTGRYLVASAQDNSLARWDLATGERVLFKGHVSWVRGLAFAPALGLVFSGSYDGRLCAWRLEDASPFPVRNLQAHDGWIRALATSRDGKLLATCGNDLRVCLWSIADGHLIRELKGHTSQVFNAAFHPSGQELASADLKGAVKRWDIASGKLLGDLDAKVLHKYDTGFRADIGGARCMQFSPAGDMLLVGGITNVSNAFAGVGNPMIVLFDQKTGKQKLQLVPKAAVQGTMWGGAFHPAGNLIVGLSSGGNAHLFFWTPDDAQALHAFRLPAYAHDLDLHPDGKRIAVAGADGTARIYDMSSTPTKA